MATKKKNTVDHRKRKDGGERERQNERRAARNAARPKQRWVFGGPFGGHWERSS